MKTLKDAGLLVISLPPKGFGLGFIFDVCRKAYVCLCFEVSFLFVRNYSGLFLHRRKAEIADPLRKVSFVLEHKAIIGLDKNFLTTITFCLVYKFPVKTYIYMAIKFPAA